MKKLFCVLPVLIFLMGCATLRGADKMAYAELEPRLKVVGLEPIEDRDSTLAGVLNILPGIGNAYLGQWGLFVCNLLFWPLSITWGIPQAATDAVELNKRDTLSFYTFGLGKKELEEREKSGAVPTSESNVTNKMANQNLSLSDKLHELKKLANSGMISQKEYNNQKQKILNNFSEEK